MTNWEGTGGQTGTVNGDVPVHCANGYQVAGKGVVGGRLRQVVQPLHHGVFVVLHPLGVRRTVIIGEEPTGIWELKDEIVDLRGQLVGITANYRAGGPYQRSVLLGEIHVPGYFAEPFRPVGSFARLSLSFSLLNADWL